jgi:hypothetical protein
MATPPTATSGALTVNSTTGVIISPVTAALFRSANGIGTGDGDVTASGVLTATRLILGGGTTVVTASDITYSTPILTVPASFGITGAGSLSFTAGGSNLGIDLTPTGSGFIRSNLWGNPTPDAPASGTMLNIVGRSGSNNLTVLDSFGSESAIMGRRYNGTFGALTGLLANQDIIRFRAFGYNGSAMVGTRAQVALQTTENWSTTAQGTKVIFYTTGNGTTSMQNVSQYESYGRFTLSPVSGSMAAWGTQGILTLFAGATITDSSSSGTVATAVGRSIQVPTFAASSSTTFTQTDHVLITGAVTSGTNVTQTARSALGFTGTYTNTAGLTTSISIRPTYNQTSGTADNVDLLINRTETAVGSGSQLLIDAQVGGVSQFSVTNTGVIAIRNTVAAAIAVASTHKVTINIAGTTYYLLATNVA